LFYLLLSCHMYQLQLVCIGLSRYTLTPPSPCVYILYMCVYIYNIIYIYYIYILYICVCVKVRWSAAKGIGRITMRLPELFGDDVIAAVLELFSDPDDDSAWHGGCLALAELSRRGLLLPDRLPAVFPIVSKAMGFDVLRGQHSVGAHVRDAACYVCWAFARAYTPAIIRPFVGTLADAMIVVALFDREVNCRRAASAAFQENVGRQGMENFPLGIEVTAIADYFSLGIRSAAYIDIAPAVARLSDSFATTIVDHLRYGAHVCLLRYCVCMEMVNAEMLR
jgi:hypothetical protein